MRTFLHDCERDDGTEIMVEYTRETYHPAVMPSWNDPGCPAEGGNVEIVAAFENGIVIELTEAEDKRIRDWLEANISNSDGDDYYD